MFSKKDIVHFFIEKKQKDGKLHFSTCSCNWVTGEMTCPSDWMPRLKGKAEKEAKDEQ